jgi:hypothetical protein
MPFSELKAGDAIMLATAVMLLTASPTVTRDIMSGWNSGTAEGAQ